MLKKILKMSIVILILGIIITLIYYNTHLATTSKITEQLFASTRQNALHYVKENHVVDKNFQQTEADFYLKRHFSPWTNKNMYYFIHDVKTTGFNPPDQYGLYGGNYKKYEESWLKKILTSMRFSSLNMRGIVVRRTSLRALPTTDPGFGNPQQAGEGYPFDHLQFSTLNEGDPLRIYAMTKNGEWVLVGSDYYFGWTKSDDVAYVSNHFVHEWMRNKFIVPLQDDIPVYDNHYHYRFSTRIGILYPILKKTEKQYAILTVAKNPMNGSAEAIHAFIPKEKAIEFPYLLTTVHAARMMNQLEDYPYGWGDMDEHRDCSSTVRDLFATFGIWLPRNSQQQITNDSAMDLSHLSNVEKEKAVIKNGVPFMTLLHKPGHVLIYIGYDKNNIYVFQNMWGLKTSILGMHKGRAIVGAPVITPLTFGSTYHNVSSTNLDDIDSLLVLANNLNLFYAIQQK